MSIRIAKIKNYLKESYQKLGEIYYAHYWNLGYISCLSDGKRISDSEYAGLSGYNDKIYFIEDMKILNRKKEIKKEELNKMELKDIEKRIAKSISYVHERLAPYSTCEEISELVNEAHKALGLYSTLIHKIIKMYYSEMYATQRGEFDALVNIIKELEERYYPEPKTIKEKLNDIINEECINVKVRDMERMQEKLEKLRDEMEG